MPKSRLSSFHPLVVLSMLAASGLAAACKSNTATPPASVSADTWAVVNGKNISRQDVEKAYKRGQDPRQTLSDEGC